LGLKAIILAAGKGTRMKSSMIKVVHHVAGKPIINCVLENVLKLGIDEVFMVTGYQENLIKEVVNCELVEYVVQKEQLGTGHAVMQVKPYLNKEKSNKIVILPGDSPLIGLESLQGLINICDKSGAVGSVLSTKMKEPGNYGRIIRGKNGDIEKIIEAKDCNAQEKQVSEVNTGVYVFEANYLFDALEKIGTNNAQKEYYLTDVIRILKDSGEIISGFCAEDPNQMIGVNTREDQAKINEIIYSKNNVFFMQEGVTIIDPKTTFIDSMVKIGMDTVIHPFTVIKGDTVIGKKCNIGSHCYIENSFIKDNDLVTPFSKLIHI
jgi:bifunctional UDP-N-acetylglucosamine pyrophosphorylase / glucosamine-1-phosphate N-acetyltransferase